MFSTTTIRTVIPLDIRDVYDISVEDDHSFVSQNILHSNSRNPNFQNIPRSTTSADIKKMFIAPEGYLLMEVDYSQAELRVVAELSGDKNMIEIFKSGNNIHVATAARMAKVSYEEINTPRKDENHPKHAWAVRLHKRAKTYNFGVLYGQTARKLAETIAEATGDPPNEKEAQKGLNDWFKAFPGVKQWINTQHKLVKRDGSVTSIFGRVRRLPNIYDDNKWVRLEAGRQSVNTPIQGAASDFTQLSSIIIRDLRLKGKLPDYLRQVYTVHDSIGFYVKPEDVHWLAKELITICANPETQGWIGFKMKEVNMKVSISLGHTWGTYSDYDEKVDYTKF